MLSVVFRIASWSQFLWVHATYHYFIEDWLDIPKVSHFVSWPGAVTLSGLKYPCREQISIVPKMSDSLKFDCITPAGTWRLYNVASTSMQRHDVASTLMWRYPNAACPLGHLCTINRDISHLGPLHFKHDKRIFFRWSGVVTLFAGFLGYYYWTPDVATVQSSYVQYFH